MNVLKIIQTLTLATLLVLVLGACSNKDANDANATAVDAVDGNLTVSISGAVDTSTVGNYTLTYTATDSAGNEANVTRSVEVVNTTPTLTSITLESNAAIVNVDDTIQLTTTGTYSDGSSNAVDENITYTIHPTDSAEVNGSVLKAKKDGNVTVQASIDGVNSNTITLNITWVVNGHVLPPEPDKALNDSTLLGIDTNDNGVRDDVERWIYEEYEQPIERGIFMQSARAYNLVIVNPSKAHETTQYIDDSSSCEFYWTYKAQDNNENFVLDRYRDLEKEISKIQFNTLDRHIAYERFNAEFNGEVFTAPASSKVKCEFNENGVLGDLK